MSMRTISFILLTVAFILIVVLQFRVDKLEKLQYETELKISVDKDAE